jgi:hypothetical protein
MIESEEELIKEKKQESATAWFSKIPLWIKIAGVLIIVFNFIKYGTSNSTIMWVVVVIVIWYMFGKEFTFLNENAVLSPEEAMLAAQKSVTFLYRTNQIDRDEKISIGPNISLFHTEGQPKYYLIQAESRRQYTIKKKRAQVYAEGDAKGYVCWQDVPYSVSGREGIPVARPKWMKEVEKYGITLKDVLSGNLRNRGN